ncbi:Uncharacterised protein r2_g1433 [Pycnogonum litorale]
MNSKLSWAKVIGQLFLLINVLYIGETRILRPKYYLPGVIDIQDRPDVSKRSTVLLNKLMSTIKTVFHKGEPVKPLFSARQALLARVRGGSDRKFLNCYFNVVSCYGRRRRR